MKEYQLQVLREKDYSVSSWEGGKTTEIYMEPREGSYQDRNFLFRISSATVELDKSIFTDLPDYDRILMTFHGDIELSHNGGEFEHFQECTPYSFDGADRTESRGRVTDFNLMLRKGRCRGLMIPLRMMGKEHTDLRSIIHELPEASLLLLYLYQGNLEIHAGMERLKLAAKESLVISGNIKDDGFLVEARDGVVAALVAVQKL